MFPSASSTAYDDASMEWNSTLIKTSVDQTFRLWAHARMHACSSSNRKLCSWTFGAYRNAKRKASETLEKINKTCTFFLTYFDWSVNSAWHLVEVGLSGLSTETWFCRSIQLWIYNRPTLRECYCSLLCRNLSVLITRYTFIPNQSKTGYILLNKGAV